MMSNAPTQAKVTSRLFFIHKMQFNSALGLKAPVLRFPPNVGGLLRGRRGGGGFFAFFLFLANDRGDGLEFVGAFQIN